MMAENSNETDVFIAEKVVDSGFGQQDGKRYYKIKWVRYTWEAEDTLSHLKDMLDVFWEEHMGNQKLKNIRTESDSPVKSDSAKTDLDENLEKDVNNESGLAVSVLLKSEANQAAVLSESESSNMQGVTSGNDINKSSLDKMFVERHSCDVCLRSYSSLQSLRHHKRTHHQGDKSYQCTTCLKYFVERSTLKRHMIIHMEEKPYKCEYCDRGFSDKSTLRRHHVTHTGAKRFSCANCGKRFTRNEHLRQHMFIHTEEKIYKCYICNKDFRQRSTLKNHMLLHRSDKKKFKCESCDEIFDFLKEFEDHSMLCKENTLRDGHKCDFCEKHFLNGDVLLRHMITHSEDETFICEKCGEVFKSELELNSHKLLHTEKQPFKCIICSQKFMRKGSLLSHITSQHPEQAVYELVDATVDYEIGQNSISLEDGVDTSPMEFVLQEKVNVNNVSAGQVKLTSDHNVSHSIIASTAQIVTTGDDVDIEATVKDVNNITERSLELPPGKNQLLQVELVRMDDGHQFVQSINAYIQQDNKLNDSETGKSIDEINVNHLEQVDQYNHTETDQTPEITDLVVDERIMLNEDGFCNKAIEKSSQNS